jgi:putative ABC transport system permease protein
MSVPPSRRPASASAWSSLKRSVRLGLRSIWIHRLRSSLTMLGIVFGVGSVIAMLAVGEGASFEAQEQIRQQGSHNIILRSVKPPEDETGSRGNSWMIEYGITYKDLQRIKETIPTVETIVPGRIFRKKVWNIGRRVDCDIVGTLPIFSATRNYPVATGRFFSESEMARQANVCVLGAEVVQDLFPLESALGNSVRIGSNYYTVVGIMEPRGAAPGETVKAGKNSNVQGSAKAVYIPLSTATSRFGRINVKRSSGSQEVERVEYHEATVKVKSLDDVIETSRIISDLMQINHKRPDFEVVVPLSLLQAAERTARIFNIVLGSIAAISLLVGGIGIMNIMLASVSERTREIGIRRAVGARQRDIIVQFLIETLLLSGIGGIAGVALGIGLPRLITYVAEQRTIVTFWSPILALGISAAIGVMFGLYPAMRAAKMDPVEALRHE